jgi:predicted HAD superfamily Cof-like phosphohydrolase
MKDYETECLELREKAAELQQRNIELVQRNTELVEQRRAACIRTNVLQFHRAMGLPVANEPQVPSDARVRLRLHMKIEELFEMLRAATDKSHWPELTTLEQRLQSVVGNAQIDVDMVEFVDALCDLDYFVEGTRLEFGVDGRPVLAEVQRANLAKVGGPKRADGKQMKPEGWQPPDIARVLREQGWRG